MPGLVVLGWLSVGSLFNYPFITPNYTNSLYNALTLVQSLNLTLFNQFCIAVRSIQHDSSSVCLDSERTHDPLRIYPRCSSHHQHSWPPPPPIALATTPNFLVETLQNRLSQLRFSSALLREAALRTSRSPFFFINSAPERSKWRAGELKRCI